MRQCISLYKYLYAYMLHIGLCMLFILMHSRRSPSSKVLCLAEIIENILFHLILFINVLGSLVHSEKDLGKLRG